MATARPPCRRSAAGQVWVTRRGSRRHSFRCWPRVWLWCRHRAAGPAEATQDSGGPPFTARSDGVGCTGARRLPTHFTPCCRTQPSVSSAASVVPGGKCPCRVSRRRSPSWPGRPAAGSSRDAPGPPLHAVTRRTSSGYAERVPGWTPTDDAANHTRGRPGMAGRPRRRRCWPLAQVPQLPQPATSSLVASTTPPSSSTRTAQPPADASHAAAPAWSSASSSTTSTV